MNIDNCLEKMKKIQSNVLEFLDDDENSDVNFQKVIDIFGSKNNSINKYELETILLLLVKIDNRHNSLSLHDKIKKIILFLI